jgi:multidrug resistance protein
VTSPPTGRFRELRSGNFGKLLVLMATAFMDMVGALMVIPLLPFYATHFGADARALAILVSSYAAMQLLSAPLWGRVSDRYGRRPALLIGLGAAAIGYVIFAFSDSFWMLLLSRLVQGAGGGTVGVIQAYVADSVEPRDRARSLGWLSAATNVGVIFGPLLGSVSAQWGHAAPGLLAAGLAVINMGFAWRFLTESQRTADRELARSARRPRELLARVGFTHAREPASRLIWIYALGMGAFYGITAILTLFLMARFDVTTRTIGFFFAYMGALNVVFRVFLLGRVVDRFGEVRTMRVGAAALALGLFLLPLTTSLPMLAVAIALMPLGTSLTFPCVTSLLSRVVAGHERGSYMGVQQTFGGMGRVIYPLWAGWAWDVLGVLEPFWTSAALVGGTILIGLGLERAPGVGEGPLAKETAARESAAKEQAAVPE